MSTVNSNNNRTVILFGSPNTEGHTYRLLDAVLQHCPAEASADLICAYDLNVRPCYGCDGCKQTGYCIRSQSDDFAQVDRILRQSSRIILATPIYFLGFPAPLKQIIDRFQPYFYHSPFQAQPPKKALLLTTSGSNDNVGVELITAASRRVLEPLHAELVSTLSVKNTDRTFTVDATACKTAAELLFQNIS
ncbi:MAG: flavodoxin family protein [Oscillospiraceae bacterium]